MVRALDSGAVDSGLIPSRAKPMSFFKIGIHSQLALEVFLIRVGGETKFVLPHQRVEASPG